MKKINWNLDMAKSSPEKWLTSKNIILGMLIPIVTSVLGAWFGSYFTTKSAIENAPKKTVAETATLISLINNLKIQLSSSNLSPDVNEAISRLELQAKAVESNAVLVESINKSTDLQADFWIKMGEGGRLGGTTQFGLYSAYSNGVKVSLAVENKKYRNITAGMPIEYKDSKGKSCKLAYAKEVEHQGEKIYGFQTTCI